MAGLWLSGCVKVETTVGKDGSVARRYVMSVRPAHEAMAREEMQSYLGKGWKPRVREVAVDEMEISAVREFPGAQELPYVQARVEGPRACGWHGLRQRYTYEELMTLGTFLSPQERQLANNLQVTVIYQLTMPGVITRSGLGPRAESAADAAGEPKGPTPSKSSSSPAGPVNPADRESGKLSKDLEAFLASKQTQVGQPEAVNKVSWSFLVADVEDLMVVAVSERLNYLRLLALVFVAVVVLAVAAYVLRPLWRWIGKKIKERAAIPPEERERQRREREERKQQQAQERAAADAARAAQSAEKKRLKAEKRQQKKAAPSEGEK
jgi:Sec-independent protein translocase protein TatA